jgi:hypothetical protein
LVEPQFMGLAFVLQVGHSKHFVSREERLQSAKVASLTGEG